MTPLTNVPTINDLMSRPELMAELPAHVAWHLLIQITSILPLFGEQGAIRSKRRKTHEDRLLVINEAAEVLRVSRDWLYRHADGLPFTVRNGRSLRFSYNGIQKYIRARVGA